MKITKVAIRCTKCNHERVVGLLDRILYCVKCRTPLTDCVDVEYFEDGTRTERKIEPAEASA